VRERFGAWPVIYGTLVSSALALLIAVPISLGCALFLVRITPSLRSSLHHKLTNAAELLWARKKPVAAVLAVGLLTVRTTLTALLDAVPFLIELLAAIPSIAYGFWGVAVLVPFSQNYLQPVLADTLGQVPLVGALFVNSGSGYNMLVAGIILAIMITPIITAVSRDVLNTVPPELEQGAYGLGATWWQATKVVLSFAKMGIFGAIILGLARAIGETMAVTMVIGNTMKAPTSLLDSGQTIASLLACQFREADTDMFSAALIYTAFLLLVITTVINGIARLLIVRVVRRGVRP